MASTLTRVPEEKNDTVTFTLFFKPTTSPEKIRDLIQKEALNIQKHIRELSSTALRVGKKPPAFKLLYYIPPETPSADKPWTPPDEIDMMVKSQWTSKSEGEERSTNFTIERFVPTTEEEEYLRSEYVRYTGGAIADIMKTRSIFQQHADGHPHLQMDTNTQIVDYDCLYAITFGAKDPRLNALLYNPDGLYIAVHNKIVFVPAFYDLRPWEEIYNRHLRSPASAKGDPNPIYDQTFGPAMTVLKFAREVRLKDHHPRYPANIVEYAEVFGLTGVVLPASHQSWKEKRSELSEATAVLPSKKEKKERIQRTITSFGQVSVDYAAWRCLINTWCRDLSSLDDDPSTGKTLMTKKELLQLRSMRDQNMDLRMLVAFCKALDKEDLPILLDEIPKTSEGIKLKSIIERELATDSALLTARPAAPSSAISGGMAAEYERGRPAFILPMPEMKSELPVSGEASGLFFSTFHQSTATRSADPVENTAIKDEAEDHELEKDTERDVSEGQSLRNEETGRKRRKKSP